MNNPDDDNSLFQSAFGDIQRIDTDTVDDWKPKPAPRPRHQADPGQDKHLAISAYPELPDEQDLNIDFFYFRRDGIQDSVFQHLKRGQPAPQQGIDLHGMTREIALRELESFISECQDRHVKHILIIHGKGGKSEQRAVLKPSVAIWLRQMPSVLAFCPAMPRDGGDGALYVLLKSS